MVAVLEMNQRDKILWELTAHGRMKKKDLRRCTGLRLSELEPILEELVREGKIRIDTTDIISLIYWIIILNS